MGFKSQQRWAMIGIAGIVAFSFTAFAGYAISAQVSNDNAQRAIENSYQNDSVQPRCQSLGSGWMYFPSGTNSDKTSSIQVKSVQLCSGADGSTEAYVTFPDNSVENLIVPNGVMFCYYKNCQPN